MKIIKLFSGQRKKIFDQNLGERPKEIKLKGTKKNLINKKVKCLTAFVTLV